MTKRYILLVNDTKEDMASYVDVFSCENLTIEGDVTGVKSKRGLGGFGSSGA